MNSAPVSPRSTRIDEVDAAALNDCGVDERRLRSPGPGFDRDPTTRVAIDAPREVIAEAGPVAVRSA